MPVSTGAESYQKACHQMLDIFGSSGDPQICERVGRACLLGVVSQEDASRAIALIDRAVHTNLPPSHTWMRPYLLVAQGLARYRAGDFDRAIESIGAESQKVLGPLPHLVLAMAHERAGRRDEALRCITHAQSMFDWHPSHAGDADAWMHHALRREAERVVMVDGLPDQPVDREPASTAPASR